MYLHLKMPKLLGQRKSKGFIEKSEYCRWKGECPSAFFLACDRNMKCNRCGNEDPSWFYHGSAGWYCRKCISFGRVLIEEELKPVSLHKIKNGSDEYMLQFPLTSLQKEVALSCMNLIDSTDVLLQCVCGAGKTEMVVASIVKMLSRGKKVCFAIARRQVVLEVSERLRTYFKNAKITAVCGGHTFETDGDLIVCTTHQLYRYHQSFDLLILDEPDAFPYRGNDVLHGIAMSSCRGHIIYLTATPDRELLGRVNDGSLHRLTLNQRPHGQPIPVPEIITLPSICLSILLLHWLRKNSSHPRMVFVPTVAMAHRLYRFLKVFVIHLYVCTSKNKDRDEVISRFRKEKHAVIVATTILERGVTIPHADICVYRADHPVFDEAGLVQMAGRAGRSFSDPYGNVLFLCGEKSNLAVKCRNALKEANRR